ncbi:MAG TPA: replicative DNA helicase [Candidatus Saccharimonadales bacterium]|nr:replicative DNA helicase [Candidatus Saccharimonadales bacterium]
MSAAKKAPAMASISEIVRAERSGKIPPHNIEAEASLIGAILIDKEAIIKIADLVTPDDFYSDNNALIFTAIMDLYEARQPLDLLTLSNKLEGAGELERVGGTSYLTDLINTVPSAAHVANYAGIVAHKATLRRLISAASEITGFGYKEDEPLDALLDQAEQKLFEVSQKHLKQNFIGIGSVLAQSFDRLDDLHKDKNKLRGIPTGFRALDNVLAGLQKSDLIVLAARPSMGKTSLALNMAQHVAVKEGVPVGLFSLEMSKEQLIDRLIASESGIDAWKLRTGNLEDSDFPKINHAMAVLSEAPIFIDDSAMTNVMEMRTKARRLQSEHDLGLIVVDYLQLVSGRSNASGDNRVQEVSEISRGLKALARELNIPVLALSQLSRVVETRNPQIPQLSDLRDSGSIEQDADVVLFIYREDYYNRDTERLGLADILIRKHRNGPIGQLELFWHPEQLAFRSLDKARTPTPS